MRGKGRVLWVDELGLVRGWGWVSTHVSYDSGGKSHTLCKRLNKSSKK